MPKDEVVPKYNVREDWLALHQEEILDPERLIVDTHHHMGDKPGARYLFPDLLADMKTGHNVRATVFMEWRSMYRRLGPMEMRPVGEVEFINGIAAQAASGNYGPHYACSAIIGNADLALGDRVEPVLQAMMQAGGKRFRGVRPTIKWHASKDVNPVAFSAPPDLMLHANFQQGARCLGRLGLSLEVWAYHTQLRDVLELARAVPETTIILNHFGGPIRNGPYVRQHDAVFADLTTALKALAQMPNVFLKLGGLGTWSAGFAFNERERPPSSAELATAWRPFFELALDIFGANRCVLESNFPVDKRMFSYPVLWNAFKRLAQAATEAEKTAMFSGTAMAIYRIDPANLDLAEAAQMPD